MKHFTSFNLQEFSTPRFSSDNDDVSLKVTTFLLQRTQKFQGSEKMIHWAISFFDQQ